MNIIFHFFPFIEGLMMIVMTISGALSFNPQYKLRNLLREKYVKRWAELAGAKFDGKQWIGGWGMGFDGIKYIYSKHDDGIEEILKLKRTIKKYWLFVFGSLFIFVFNFFVVVIVLVMNGGPDIKW